MSEASKAAVERRDGLFYWPKGTNEQLSVHFSTKEFECHCRRPACGQQRIAVDMVERLEDVRSSIKIPLTVTSGFRCTAHQLELTQWGFETAKGKSQHELGRAVDLTCRNMSGLAAVAGTVFKAVGVARSFVHVDLRDDKFRRWAYVK
jgi:uncharacterized protein YcbK (DUF882 family)